MARSFNAGTDRIVIPYNSGLVLSTTLSIAAWVYPTVISGERTFIGKPANQTHATPFWDWFMGMNASGLVQTRFTGSSANKFSTSALVVNTWSHVAITYDGANVRFYINGVLDATVADTGSVTNLQSQGPRIGSNRDNAETLSGSLAHVCVWNSTLTINEIKSHKAGKIPCRGSLKGFYPLLSSSSTATPNLSGLAAPTPTLGTTVAGAGVSTFTTAGIDTTGMNFIVVSVGSIQTATAPVITDSKGNTWTTLTAVEVAANLRHQLVYCFNPVVGTSHTFTCTRVSGFMSISVASFSGVQVESTVFDQQSTASVDPATTIQAGSITPTNGGELLISGYTEGSNPPIATIGSGFTVAVNKLGVIGTNYSSAVAYLVQGSAAAINPTWTLNASAPAAASIASFRNAGTVGVITGPTYANQPQVAPPFAGG